MKFLQECIVPIAFLLVSGVLCQIEFPDDKVTEAPELLQRFNSVPQATKPLLKFDSLLELREENHEAQFLLETPGSNSVDYFANPRSFEWLSNGTKAKVTVGCDMFFSLYPFDMHSCGIKLTQEVIPLFCGPLKAYEFQAKGYLSVPKITLPGKGNKTITISPVIYLLIERTSAMQIFSQMYSPVMMLAWLSFLTMLSSLSHPIRVASSLSLLLCILVVTTIIWPEIPRAGKGDLTFLEHYFALCVGFVFQVFFNNVLMYWYSCMAQKHAKESSSDPEQGTNGVSLSTNGDLPKSTEKLSKSTTDKPESDEERFVKTMGKCHRFMYFKGLKPAKKQLPIAFLVLNLIYWPIVLYLSSGLPKGFQYLPKSAEDSGELARHCL